MCGAVVRGPGGTDGARMGTPAASGGAGRAGPAARGLAARGGCPSAAVGFRYQTEGGPTGRLPYL